ncbi:MAG: efflux RND transporter periplasmic adaptor subunit [Methylophilaceae bacterium]
MKRLHLLLAIVFAALIGIIIWLGWDKFHSKTSTESMVNESMPSTSMGINPAAPAGVVQDNSGKVVKYWYDPMVPAQKFDKPGKSPFMEMQLEPKYAEAGGEDAGVVISSQTQQNLGIRLAKVEMHELGNKLSAVGRIQPDERKLYVIQTRILGFVERLLVRAIGDQVSKGQKVAEMYAPELLAAQQEYLALKGYESDSAKNGLAVNGLAQAARNRLKLLGMSEGEIAAITLSGKSSPRFGIYAPASGVLTELNVREGGQLMPGTSLMQITDLSNVWLIADVPEQDASKLKLGNVAEVQLQGLADPIKGKISYIYPSLDATTRSLQVRVELTNKGGRLRPSMYANVDFTGESHEALSVPSEAVIATGTRKVVIVKLKNGFHPVDVTTGQENDSSTEILQGLSEGDEVVASGQFLIDSEATLSGVLSKLSQPAEKDAAMSGMSMKESATHELSNMKMPVGHGKIMAIDAKSGKITLAHEPIAVLGWPAMTMDFSVKDTKSLTKLKVGDMVQFELKSNPKTEQYDIEHIDKQVSEMLLTSKLGAHP